MIEKTNHEVEGLALLVTQYKNRANLSAVLSAYLPQVQELEGVLFDILEILSDLENQTNAQLDLVGALVGQDREGRTDDVYLRWIQARQAINRSSGLVDEMLTVLALISPDNGREYKEFPPASFTIDLFEEFTGDIEAVAGIIGLMRGAGINGQLIYSEHADSNTFTFSTGDTEESSSTLGWADDSPITLGGYFADVEGT